MIGFVVGFSLGYVVAHLWMIAVKWWETKNWEERNQLKFDFDQLKRRR